MTWRQELARRDTLSPSDDLRDMIGALDWASQEALRTWLILRQERPDADSGQDTLRELQALLPWIPDAERRCLVRVARAMAERR